MTDNSNNGLSVENINNDSEKFVSEKDKKRKTILRYVIFIIINTIVVGGLILFENKSGDRVTGRAAFSLLGKNWWYTVIFLSIYFIIVLGDSVVFYILIRKMQKGKSAALAVKVSLLGRYYDRITPWATGGEPFQIAYLVSGGLSLGDSGAVTMSRHIIRFFTTAITVIIVLIVSRISTNIYVMLAAIVSVLLGLAVPIFMLVCCIKPKLGQAIGRAVITFLYKIKLVKNYEKQLAKMNKEVNNFVDGLKYLSVNKWVIVVIALVSLIELFGANSIPFFVMKALGVSQVTYWKTLVLCIFVNYSASFAPSPGGAGIAELSFYAIFAAFVSQNYIFWAVLLWRIAIFYLPVLIGFVVQNTESVIKIIKAKKSQ